MAVRSRACSPRHHPAPAKPPTADPSTQAGPACARCLARSKLLERLNVRIDYSCRDATSLRELLALDDEALIDALGGRKRDEIRRLQSEFEPSEIESVDGVSTICAHSAGPFALPQTFSGALFMHGDPNRLPRREAAKATPSQAQAPGTTSSTAPVVAIIASKIATSYGAELAYSLAGALASAGVTVASTFSEGIGAAALSGVLDAGQAPLAAMPGGAAVISPQHLNSLGKRIAEQGVALSLTPPFCQPRRWGLRAAIVLASELAQASILVEARVGSIELDVAEALARAKAPLAATPGRLSTPAAYGANLLIKRGEATMLTGAEDVVDLLFHLGGRADAHGAQRCCLDSVPLRLHPELQAVLERIDAGEDTFSTLTSDERATETMLALAELEARGALQRDAGGRYIASSRHHQLVRTPIASSGDAISPPRAQATR